MSNVNRLPEQKVVRRRTQVDASIACSRYSSVVERALRKRTVVGSIPTVGFSAFPNLVVAGRSEGERSMITRLLARPR